MKEIAVRNGYLYLINLIDDIMGRKNFGQLENRETKLMSSL